MIVIRLKPGANFIKAVGGQLHPWTNIYKAFFAEIILKRPIFILKVE
jgi:hypothetical protein